MRRVAEPGSALHLGLWRIALALHAFSVLSSPALDLLVEFRARPQPLTQSWLPTGVESWLAQGGVGAVAAIGLVAAVATALGLGLRLAAPVLLAAFVLTQNYWYRSTAFHDDWLYFTTPLLLLALAPQAADRLSVAAWLRERRGDAPPVREPSAHRWPLEVHITWVALLYAAAGLAKILPLSKGVEWLSGRTACEFACEFAPDSPLVWLLGRTPFAYPEHVWIFALASGLTVVLELGALAMVFSASTALRGALMLGLLAMHLTIYWLGIPGFPWMWLVSAVAFLPDRLFSDTRPALPSKP